MYALFLQNILLFLDLLKSSFGSGGLGDVFTVENRTTKASMGLKEIRL
jgi:hypothetical protein